LIIFKFRCDEGLISLEGKCVNNNLTEPKDSKVTIFLEKKSAILAWEFKTDNTVDFMLNCNWVGWVGLGF